MAPLSTDLLSFMLPYWDPHFLVKALELPPKHWTSAEADQLKLKVLEKTNMLEKTNELRKKLGQTDKVISDAELVESEVALESQVEQLRAVAVGPLREALAAYRRSTEGRSLSGAVDRITLSALTEWWDKHNNNIIMEEETDNNNKSKKIPPNVDGLILQLSKLLYSMGRYSESKAHLDFYLEAVCVTTIENVRRKQACLWGVAAAVLMAHPLTPTEELEGGAEVDKGADALDESRESIRLLLTDGDAEPSLAADLAVRALLRLYDTLESPLGAAANSRTLVVLQKSWLLHWAVWLFMRYYLYLVHAKNRPPRSSAWSVLAEWLLSENNLSVVHLVCPHLLRYYAVYAILNRSRREHCQAIVGAVSTSKDKYSDAFTRLMEALYISFDFDAAQRNMSEIAECCENDFFLSPLKNEVEEAARLLIFETYCRIHRSINIEMIAKKLNMPAEVAERWIVNLIRHAKLEAKIDSEKNRVEMCGFSPNIYHQVVEKTRSLLSRSNLVYTNLTSNRWMTADGKFDGGTSGGGGRGRGGDRGDRGGGGGWYGGRGRGGDRGDNRGDRGQPPPSVRWGPL
eukprot:GHVS01015451.1.p1 GENE.GHVS01015451.1~~GHVS01015451.1.p1  ORF type:complete len:587 (+),score=124.49 GHVS01015451.1:48-1763(+)